VTSSQSTHECSLVAHLIRQLQATATYVSPGYMSASACVPPREVPSELNVTPYVKMSSGACEWPLRPVAYAYYTLSSLHGMEHDHAYSCMEESVLGSFPAHLVALGFKLRAPASSQFTNCANES
jgi:hypothetical protein